MRKGVLDLDSLDSAPACAVEPAKEESIKVVVRIRPHIEQGAAAAGSAGQSQLSICSCHAADLALLMWYAGAQEMVAVCAWRRRLLRR